MEPEEDKTTEKTAKGYDKRPMWQWVVIYFVAAVVVYGVIYYIFIGDGGY